MIDMLGTIMSVLHNNDQENNLSLVASQYGELVCRLNAAHQYDGQLRINFGDEDVALKVFGAVEFDECIMVADFQQPHLMKELIDELKFFLSSNKAVLLLRQALASAEIYHYVNKLNEFIVPVGGTDFFRFYMVSDTAYEAYGYNISDCVWVEAVCGSIKFQEFSERVKIARQFIRRWRQIEEAVIGSPIGIHFFCEPVEYDGKEKKRVQMFKRIGFEDLITDTTTIYTKDL